MLRPRVLPKYSSFAATQAAKTYQDFMGRARVSPAVPALQARADMAKQQKI
jgi:hypothetical protein